MSFTPINPDLLSSFEFNGTIYDFRSPDQGLDFLIREGCNFNQEINASWTVSDTHQRRLATLLFAEGSVTTILKLIGTPSVELGELDYFHDYLPRMVVRHPALQKLVDLAEKRPWIRTGNIYLEVLHFLCTQHKSSHHLFEDPRFTEDKSIPVKMGDDIHFVSSKEVLFPISSEWVWSVKRLEALKPTEVSHARETIPAAFISPKAKATQPALRQKFRAVAHATIATQLFQKRIQQHAPLTTETSAKIELEFPSVKLRDLLKVEDSKAKSRQLFAHFHDIKSQFLNYSTEAQSDVLNAIQYLVDSYDKVAISALNLSGLLNHFFQILKSSPHQDFYALVQTSLEREESVHDLLRKRPVPLVLRSLITTLGACLEYHPKLQEDFVPHHDDLGVSSTSILFARQAVSSKAAVSGAGEPLLANGQ